MRVAGSNGILYWGGETSLIPYESHQSEAGGRSLERSLCREMEMIRWRPNRINKKQGGNVFFIVPRKRTMMNGIIIVLNDCVMLNDMQHPKLPIDLFVDLSAIKYGARQRNGTTFFVTGTEPTGFRESLESSVASRPNRSRKALGDGCLEPTGQHLHRVMSCFRCPHVMSSPATNTNCFTASGCPYPHPGVEAELAEQADR